MNCSHGTPEDDFCMLCCREGENKPAEQPKEPPLTWEEAMERPAPGESPWED